MTLRREDYNYKGWFTEEEKSADTTLKGDEKQEFSDIPTMPPPEGVEVLKKGTEIKILTPNKLLTRLPVLLAQIKAGNNWYWTMKAGKYYTFCINIIKSPKHLTTI